MHAAGDGCSEGFTKLGRGEKGKGGGGGDRRRRLTTVTHPRNDSWLSIFGTYTADQIDFRMWVSLSSRCSEEHLVEKLPVLGRSTFFQVHSTILRSQRWSQCLDHCSRGGRDALGPSQSFNSFSHPSLLPRRLILPSINSNDMPHSRFDRQTATTTTTHPVPNQKAVQQDVAAPCKSLLPPPLFASPLPPWATVN